jgi:cytochrome P450
VDPAHPDTLGCPAAPEERIAHFSTFAPWLQGDPDAPLEAFSELREAGPVLRSEEFGGYWILTRYEDVAAVARNTEVFRNAHNLVPARNFFGRDERAIPLELDGPIHAHWRRTLFDLFSPAAVDAVTPNIRATCRQLVEVIARDDTVDFVPSFAVQLPAEAFLLSFGIDRSKLAQLLDYKNWLVREGLPNATTDEEVQAAQEVLLQFFQNEINHRRSKGRTGPDDVIGKLMNATLDGRPLSDREIINASHVTMMASLDTTTSALSLSFRYLASDRRLQQLVRSSSERIPMLSEELIRHEPVLTTARLVAEPFDLHGVALSPGDMVLMPWGMTGLDPDAFDQPADLQPDREVTRNLAFGVGPHRCLGMHLARRIIAIALEEWHAAIPRYRLAPDAPVMAHFSPVRGLLTLPLDLTAPPSE